MQNIIPLQPGSQDLMNSPIRKAPRQRSLEGWEHHQTGVLQSDIRWEKRKPSLIEDTLVLQTKKALEELKGIRKELKELKEDYKVVSDQIYSIPSDDWRLINPINIIIKIYSDEAIALFPDLELYAEGQNELEAVSNLKLELLDLIEDLEEFPETELGANPKSWKKTINMIVEKCQ